MGNLLAFTPEGCDSPLKNYLKKSRFHADYKAQKIIRNPKISVNWRSRCLRNLEVGLMSNV